MNEHDPLEETLARFREIEPPADVRRANRMAVRAALERRIATHWWQRSLTIPLPAAMATAAALVVSLTLHLFHAHGNGELPTPSIAVEHSAGADNFAATLVAASPRAEYSETQSYLSGVGVIRRNIVYQIKE